MAPSGHSRPHHPKVAGHCIPRVRCASPRVMQETTTQQPAPQPRHGPPHGPADPPPKPPPPPPPPPVRDQPLAPQPGPFKRMRAPPPPTGEGGRESSPPACCEPANCFISVPEKKYPGRVFFCWEVPLWESLLFTQPSLPLDCVKETEVLIFSVVAN